MAESNSHKRAKKRAAGKNGQTEVSLCTGQKLDALTKNKKIATEVERSGRTKRYKEALQRLVDSGAPVKKLQVQDWYIEKAKKAALDSCVPCIITNIGETRMEEVKPEKCKPLKPRC